MYEAKKWVAVTRRVDGKIEIFHKWVDELEPWAIEAFRDEIIGWGGEILAMFRADDVEMGCSL